MAADEFSASQILDALAVPAVMLDGAGAILEANPAFLSLLARAGASRSDLVGRRIEELSAELDESVLKILADSRGGAPLNTTGLTVWRAGEPRGRNTDVLSAPLGEGGEGTLVLFSEPSDASRARQEIRRHGRLSWLGVVAAGVAHDLNNQLSATLNIAALLREELGPYSGHERALEIIEGSASEAAKLAHHLLRFAGRGVPEIGVQPLGDIIERASLLIRHELPQQDRFGIERAPDLGQVRGDPVLLEQLVVGLLLAAVQHAGEKATLTVAARNEHFTRDRLVGGRRLPAGSYALLETRCLVRADALDPVADEITAGIAADVGGGMEIELVDRSLVQRVFLPLMAADQATAGGAQSRPEEAREETDRAAILIVDDDPMVRDIASAMVERLDFRAITARGGIEAVEIVADANRRIDLVILDLVMNDLDGMDTLNLIREHRPDLKVLVSSGFPGATAVSGSTEVRIDGTLQKPYTFLTLKNALESAFH